MKIEELVKKGIKAGDVVDIIITGTCHAIAEVCEVFADNSMCIEVLDASLPYNSSHLSVKIFSVSPEEIESVTKINNGEVFEIMIEETLSKSFKVFGKDQEDAIQAGLQKYYGEEIVLGSEDISNRCISVNDSDYVSF